MVTALDQQPCTHTQPNHLKANAASAGECTSLTTEHHGKFSGEHLTLKASPEQPANTTVHEPRPNSIPDIPLPERFMNLAAKGHGGNWVQSHILPSI